MRFRSATPRGRRRWAATRAACLLLLAAAASPWWAAAQGGAAAVAAGPVDAVPGMPLQPDRNNLYSEIGAGRLSPAVAGALERIYVPNRAANTVSVIDPATLKVVNTFKVGINPQHVVPAWDLRTL